VVHGQDPLVDQLDDVSEGTEKVRHADEHLRLGRLEPIWVELLALEVAEESLHRRRVIRVLAREDCLNAELAEVFPDALFSVVRRVVEKPDRVVSPVLVLLREQVGQP